MSAPGGTFLALEGAVVGTATRVATLVRDALAAEGRDAVLVPRFSATVAGTVLATGYARDPFLRLSPITEALLQAADAASLTECCIAPAVRRGSWAVKATYIDSIFATLAPRLREEGLEGESRRLEGWLRGVVAPFAIAPSLTVVLVEDVGAALERASLEHGWKVRPADVALADEVQRRLAGMPAAGRLAVELERGDDRAAREIAAAARHLAPTGPSPAGAQRGETTLDQFGVG